MFSAANVCPNSILLKDCFRETIRRLKATAKEDDLAPWHEVLPPDWEEDPTEFIKRRKLWDRAKRVLLVGLLSADLRAQCSDGLQALDVPGWAWEGAENTNQAWFDSVLPLNVFLPESSQRWSGEDLFLDRKAFEDWLDRQDLTDTSALLILPLSRDTKQKPKKMEKRRPPEIPFVTLSEALSWIAFGFALDQESLYQEMDRIDAERCLEKAVAKLTEKASGELIKLQGKYVRSGWLNADHLDTGPIDPIRLHDFRKFDILYDGLRFGRDPLTPDERSGLVDVLHTGRSDAYRSVIVNRDELLKQFPNGSHISPMKEIQRLSDKEVVEWCKRWINEGRGTDGNKAWNVFKREHSGTKRDSFRYAWNEAKR